MPTRTKPREIKTYSARVFELMYDKFGIDGRAEVVDDFVLEEEKEEEEQPKIEEMEDDVEDDHMEADLDWDKVEL